MDNARRIALGVALGLLVLHAWQNGWLSQIAPTPATIEAAVIVHETKIGKPTTPEETKLITGAPALGVFVIDQNLLGPGKQPSPKMQPYLDKAKDQELPVLILRWPGGKLTVEPVTTLEALKARIGK